MGDYDHGTGSTATAMNLLKSVGGFSRPSGRGWYMFRSLTVGSSTAAVVGVFSAVFLGVLTGAGALGFIIGSIIGFTGGTLHYFHMTKAEAFDALRRYPRLMQHHLHVNFSNLSYGDLDAERRLKDGTLIPWFEGKGDAEYDNAPLHFLGYFRRSIGERFRAIARQGHLMSSYQTAQDSLIEIDAKMERSIVDGVVDAEIARYRTPVS